ncbi:MAG: hypothetical protein WAS27_01790 [Candidatus Saccharimonadales bacterium]
MPSTNLLNQLKAEYPQFTFRESSEFRWSAESRTLYVNLSDAHAPLFLLHELAHALLDHQSYAQDIHLMQIERDAWALVERTLGGRYGITFDESVAQDNLETYREWLHDRSRCPSCTMTGLQSLHGRDYTCLGCGCRWKSNEARTCALRRTTM